MSNRPIIVKEYKGKCIQCGKEFRSRRKIILHLCSELCRGRYLDMKYKKKYITLTKTQLKLLRLINDHKQPMEISQELGIKSCTVQGYVSQIKKKGIVINREVYRSLKSSYNLEITQGLEDSYQICH